MHITFRSGFPFLRLAMGLLIALTLSSCGSAAGDREGTVSEKGLSGTLPLSLFLLDNTEHDLVVEVIVDPETSDEKRFTLNNLAVDAAGHTFSGTISGSIETGFHTFQLVYSINDSFFGKTEVAVTGIIGVEVLKGNTPVDFNTATLTHPDTDGDRITNLIELKNRTDPRIAAPGIPQNPAIIAGDAQVTLQWPSVSGATYNIYWSTASGVTKGTGSRIENVTPPFDHTGRTNGATYFYVITAVGLGGESAESAQLSATPQPAIPSVPSNPSATSGNGSITLRWSNVSGALSYNVYWSTTPGVTKGTGSRIEKVTSPFVHTDLTNGTTYFYVITAVGSGGESTESAEVSAVPRISPPQNPSATSGDSSVTLQWSPVSGATSYNIYGATTSGVTKAPQNRIANVTTTTFVHTSLNNGTTYYYVITAVGLDGESAASIQVSATPRDPKIPIAEIFFPPKFSLTEGSQITVTGTASDDIVVKVVQVNGFDASSSDGFVHWKAVVSLLNPGVTTLQVKVKDDTDTFFDAASVKIRRALPWSHPNALAIDAANNRAFVIDFNRAALFAVDLNTGNRTLLSDASFGGGETFFRPEGIVLDTANNRALVTDSGRDALFAVNLTNGNRTILSDASNGTGKLFQVPDGVAFVSANRVLVADAEPSRGGLFSVDLNTGDRTVLSDRPPPEGDGAGTNFVTSRGVILDPDPANNRAFVSDSAWGALFSVDLATGNRTLVSGELPSESRGEGPKISGPVGMVFDVDSNRILVAASFSNALFSVDLATGDRTLLSGSRGTGPEFVSPMGMVPDFARNRVLVIGSGRDALFAVDLTTGNRTIVSEASTGVGTIFSSPEGVALDPVRNRALVTDLGRDALFSIDLNTGDRSILSDALTGTGVDFVAPRGVALDAANNRALVTDFGRDALLAVDLNSGQRSIFSDASAGTGDPFLIPRGVAVDADLNRALVIDSGRGGLFAVNLNTGDRRVLSDASTGGGTNFSGPAGIALDSLNNRALITDSTLAALFIVNLNSGNRTLLSSGAPFVIPEGVTLDTANNRVLVTDAGPTQRALFAVDLNTGNRTFLSNPSKGRGTEFLSPTGMVLDAAHNRILVIDSAYRALFVVEPQSGDRVILAK